MIIIIRIYLDDVDVVLPFFGCKLIAKINTQNVVLV